MEDEPANLTGQGELFFCPSCGRGVETIRGEAARSVHCPHCGDILLLPGNDGSTHLSDGPDDSARRREEELDAKRIARMAALRRSAYRSRSYCLVAVGGCLGAAAELVFDAVRRCRANGTNIRFLYAILYVAAAGALLRVGWHFARLARRYHHEASRSALGEPSLPPDFSGLQDGSQTVKNLEKL